MKGVGKFIKPYVEVNGYDLDGVIYHGKDHGLVIVPDKDGIIITGRSYEEANETLEFLHSNGIHNQVFFNRVRYQDKTREKSGRHKAFIINQLYGLGIKVTLWLEDDPIQADLIRKHVIHPITICMVGSDYVDKENHRHGE